MKFLACLMLGLLHCGTLAAAVPLFTVGPGDKAAPAPREKPDEFTLVAFDVVTNVRGIAENALRERPDSVSLSLPTRNEAMSFTQYKFESLEGFTFNERGEVVLDPNVPFERVRYTWAGVTDYADVLLVVGEGRATARIVVDNDVYELITTGKDATLSWLDTSKFAPEFQYPPARQPKTWMFPTLPAAPKYIDRIKVLVVHTGAALTELGATGVVDRVEASIASLQTTLTKSDIIQTQVDLVRVGGNASTLVSYDQSPTTTNPTERILKHRAWVRTSSAVAALRNTHQADLVVMLVVEPEIGGVAYIQRPDCTLDFAYGTDSGVTCAGIGPGFAPLAVAVVNVRQSLADLTLAHEVGHIFGLEHERLPPPNTSASQASRPWSFGHAAVSPDLARGSRTVMHVYNPCPTPPNEPANPCPRRMNYSNPYVNFTSFPLTPSGTLTPDLGRIAFNARTFALLAPIVSEFRGPSVPDRIFRHDFEALPDVGL